MHTYDREHPYQGRFPSEDLVRTESHCTDETVSPPR